MVKGIRTDIYGRGYYTFLDQPIQHHVGELYLVERLMCLNKFDSIIELGTLYGGLTLLLGLHALRLNARVLTIDIRDEPTGFYQKLKDILPITFLKSDIFSMEAEQLIKEMIANSKKTLLYCDGGNKAKEFNTFAPLIKKGDIIIAHDHPREIKLSQIQETIDRNNLTPIYWNEKISLNSRQIFYRRD